MARLQQHRVGYSGPGKNGKKPALAQPLVNIRPKIHGGLPKLRRIDSVRAKMFEEGLEGGKKEAFKMLREGMQANPNVSLSDIIPQISGVLRRKGLIVTTAMIDHIYRNAVSAGVIIK